MINQVIIITHPQASISARIGFDRRVPVGTKSHLMIQEHGEKAEFRLWYDVNLFHTHLILIPHITNILIMLSRFRFMTSADHVTAGAPSVPYTCITQKLMKIVEHTELYLCILATLVVIRKLTCSEFRKVRGIDTVIGTFQFKDFCTSGRQFR